MTCKDCMYYFLCANSLTDNYIENMLEKSVEENCLYFKDKSKIIELPCKVGDTVYTIRWWKDIQKKCKGEDGKNYYRTEHRHYVKKQTFSLFDYSDFGKTVFLTREEAKKALKEREKNNE